MAIRDWWIDRDARFAQLVQVTFHNTPQNSIHVIDATGMPSKEEIRETLNHIGIFGDIKAEDFDLAKMKAIK